MLTLISIYLFQVLLYVKTNMRILYYAILIIKINSATLHTLNVPSLSKNTYIRCCDHTSLFNMPDLLQYLDDKKLRSFQKYIYFLFCHISSSKTLEYHKSTTLCFVKALQFSRERRKGTGVFLVIW